MRDFEPLHGLRADRSCRQVSDCSAWARMSERPPGPRTLRAVPSEGDVVVTLSTMVGDERAPEGRADGGGASGAVLPREPPVEGEIGLPLRVPGIVLRH